MSLEAQSLTPSPTPFDVAAGYRAPHEVRALRLHTRRDSRGFSSRRCCATHDAFNARWSPPARELLSEREVAS